jgi:hypothetical protein
MEGKWIGILGLIIGILSFTINFLVCPIIGPPQLVDSQMEGIIYGNKISGNITYLSYPDYPSFSYSIHKIISLKFKNPLLPVLKSYKYKISSNITNLQVDCGSAECKFTNSYIVIKSKKSALTDQFSWIKIEYDESIKPRVEVKSSIETYQETSVVVISIKNEESFKILRFWGDITVPLHYLPIEDTYSKYRLNTTIPLIQSVDVYNVTIEAKEGGENIILPYAIEIRYKWPGPYDINLEWQWQQNISVPYAINLEPYSTATIYARISQEEPGKIAVYRHYLPAPPCYVMHAEKTEKGFITEIELIQNTENLEI